jgi:uncharacterized membrane protein YeiH
MTLLQLLDYAGVAVIDLIGFIFLAIVTGVGGGTLRDVILGQTPVFWVREPGYLIVATATAIVVYITAHLVWSRYLWLLWLDAIGLGAYCVIGAAKGLALGFSAPIAVVTGIMTATFGGILRDIVTGEPSVLMRREIYVTAALLGASVFTLLSQTGLADVWAAPIAAAAAFLLRGGALYFGWTFPVYRTREGRTLEEVEAIKPSKLK